jgi:hypothetical protein
MLLILALNARVPARHPSAFDTILKEYPTAQILAWARTGELSIEMGTVNSIQVHFDETALSFGNSASIALEDYNRE